MKQMKRIAALALAGCLALPIGAFGAQADTATVEAALKGGLSK